MFPKKKKSSEDFPKQTGLHFRKFHPILFEVIPEG